MTKDSPLEALGNDPIALFQEWFDAAKKTGMDKPEAVNLSTATITGKVSSRIVLLKEVQGSGFVFFSNYNSRKAKDLQENANAALTFFWNILDREVRIEGMISKISREESEKYFATRPRESQLGAWASHQSAVISSREELLVRYREYEELFLNKPVPCPDYWGGYKLTPEVIEFWQGQVGRLHDRFLFRKAASGWTKSRLSP